MTKPARILVIKPSSLGDVFQTFPAVGRMARACPEAEFDWLIHPGGSAALDYSPVKISARIPFRRRELGSWRLPQETAALIRLLRRERYDLAIDFQGLLRSAFFGWTSRTGCFAGFARPRERSAACFYSRRYPVDMEQHAVDRSWRLAEMALGLTPEPLKLPPLPVAPEAAQKARELLARAGAAPGRRLIAVAPGARWPSKRFPAELFSRLLLELRRAAPELEFVLLGTAAEAEAAAAIARTAGALNLTGQTDLHSLMEILRLCDTLICNDSGPMHMASALGVPVAVFYGPTRMERTGPWGPGHLTFAAEELECLGCLKRECPREVPECRNIDVEAAARRIANQRGWR